MNPILMLFRAGLLRHTPFKTLIEAQLQFNPHEKSMTLTAKGYTKEETIESHKGDIGGDASADQLRQALLMGQAIPGTIECVKIDIDFINHEARGNVFYVTPEGKKLIKKYSL